MTTAELRENTQFSNRCNKVDKLRVGSVQVVDAIAVFSIDIPFCKSRWRRKGCWHVDMAMEYIGVHWVDAQDARLGLVECREFHRFYEDDCHCT